MCAPSRDQSGEQPRREGVRQWATAIAFAAFVLVVSLIPIPGSRGAGDGTGDSGGGSVGAVVEHLPGWVGLTDPFHLVGYAVLALLVTRTVGTGRTGLVIAVVVATGFGFGVELAQATIPWRTFAWTDVGINAVGAVAGTAVASVLARRRTSRESSSESARDPPS